MSQKRVFFINKKVSEFFVQGKNVAINYSAVGCKGKIIFKAYNPVKPNEMGL
jgi:hypothetical protein